MTAWILLQPIGDAQSILWQYSGIPGSLYGWRLAGVGDLNGDGLGDLAVGAPNVQGGWTYLHSGTDGTILLYLLGPLTGPAPDGGLGISVAAPGDVTGDGTPDILLGSLELGQARLYSGASGTLVFQWSLGDYAFVGPGEDFNGDGVPEVLVGTPLLGGVGAAYAFSGADGSSMYSWAGSFWPELFGNALTGLCDVSADGIPDLLIGAPDLSQGPFPCGQGYARIYSGATGALIDQVSPGSPGCHLVFGGAVVRLRDVTGDGICDFAVADRTADLGKGEVRVYSGSDRSLVTTLVGNTPGEWLGDVIGSADDVDGDGIDDLIAGAPYAPPFVPLGTGGSGPLAFAGRAVVYSGSDWSVLLDFVPPPGEFLEFGRGVDRVGDVNGDDFVDLAVGAANSVSLGLPTPPTIPGKVYVLSGAPAGVVAFGQGCPSPPGVVPRIGATKPPRVGTTFKVNLSRVSANLPVLLLLGFSNAAWWTVPLPLDLTFAGLPGCALLVSPDHVVALTSEALGTGDGRVVAPLGIPPDGSLVGAAFYAQWYAVDPGPAPIPGAMTPGLAVTIQP
jgi:VCBS repeat protein/FG-GAP repeat protein